MRYYIDEKLRRHVKLFDGVQELMDDTVTNRDRSRDSSVTGNKSWVGRYFTSFAEVAEQFTQPQPEESTLVREMIEQIGSELPAPQSVRRKAQFHDSEGDVDIPRALSGDGEMFRRVHRLKSHAATNVSLLCKIGELSYVDHQDILWRGAAAAAVADRLEEAGYRCEINGQILSEDTYSSAPRDLFLAYRIKSCEDVLDLDVVTAALSAWFFRAVVLGNFTTLPTWRTGLGRSQPYSSDWLYDTLDLNTGIQVVEFPGVTSKTAAIQAAKDVIAQVTNSEV